MINHSSLISVIIATKNSAKYIEVALNSVFNSEYSNFELIIVDANSNDDTKDIIKKFLALPSSRIKILNQTSQGLYNAWNEALEHVNGEFISFLDSDDYWSPQRLKIGLELLNKKPELDFVISKFEFFLEEGCNIPKGFNSKFNTPLIGMIPGTLLARKSTFDQVGNFNQKYSIAGDVDWFARAKDMKLKYEVIDHVLLYKRIHESNLSSMAKTNTEQLLKLLKESIQRKK